MDITYWHKQTDQPLFPELLWSRPQNRRLAGKLLIVGGNLHGFAAVAQAYVQAQQAGAGVIRSLLPDALKKTLGRSLEQADYVSSTPSGSFSQQALGDLLEQAAWSDAVLLAGDLGRNSETAILLEKFVTKHRGPIVITKDAVDYFSNNSLAALDRPQTCLVLSLSQLQKITKQIRWPEAVTFSMDLVRLIENLHQLTSQHPAFIIVKHQQNLLAAVNGQVSTTKLTDDPEIWRLQAASLAVVWWLQNADQPLAALTTAIHQLANPDNQHAQ